MKSKWGGGEEGAGVDAHDGKYFAGIIKDIQELKLI